MMKVRKPSTRETEKAASWDTWIREPSEFSWYYDEKETCYILEGNAKVTDKQGYSIEFGPGDWVEFEKGLECRWTITRTIQKKYLVG